MREYAKISPRLWIGNTGKLLRGNLEAQVLASYLLSSPHSNYIGLYYLPIAYICADLGISEEGAMKGLQRLSEVSFMGYDRFSEVVFVYEMATIQIGDSLSPTDNQVKGIQSTYDNLPKNVFLPEFFDRYAECYHLKNRRGYEGASEILGSREIETEMEMETEKEIKPPISPKNRSKKDSGIEFSADFEVFWKHYPRKVKKGSAYKAWVKQRPSLDECLKTLEWQKRSEDWTKESGAYVPHPTSWINSQRWLDEPVAFKKGGGYTDYSLFEKERITDPNEPVDKDGYPRPTEQCPVSSGWVLHDLEKTWGYRMEPLPGQMKGTWIDEPRRRKQVAI